MTTLERVFYLIKSLSTSEKAYVARRIEETATKKVRLFQEMRDHVTKSPDLDRGLFTAYPRAVISDLYGSIMEEIRAYWGKHVSMIHLHNHLSDAAIFNRKKAYELALDSLADAAKIAHQLAHTKYLLIIYLLRRETQWHLSNQQSKGQPPLSDLDQTIAEQLRLLAQEIEYEERYFQLYDLAKSNYHLSEEEVAKLLADGADFLSPETLARPCSERAERRRLLCAYLYHQLTGDFDAMTECFAKVIHWWEAQEKIQNEDCYAYINDLVNFGYTYLAKERFVLVKEVISRLEEFRDGQQRNRDLLNHIAEKATKLKQAYFLNTGQDGRMRKLFREVSPKLGSFAYKDQLFINHNFAIFFFCKKEYAVARELFDEIYQNRANHRLDLVWAGGLLLLVTLLETGEVDLFESHFQRLIRKLAKDTDSKSAFYQRIARLVRRYLHTPLRDRKAVLDEIEEALRGSISKGFPREELLRCWLKDKLGH